MRKIRKINLKILSIKTLIYRVFIILIQALFTFLYIRDFSKAFHISLFWNLINIILYFSYECLFAKKWNTVVQTNGFVLWLTGLPCSGKSSIGDYLANILKEKGLNVERLDGDIVRKSGLSNDLTFSKEDRDKNINRVIFVSKLLAKNKTIVITSFVSPYARKRLTAKKLIKNYIEVYVKCSSKECIKRDVKGMYNLAKEGKIKDFTGYSSPYEIPKKPDIICDTEKETLEESANKILDYLKRDKLCF